MLRIYFKCIEWDPVCLYEYTVSVQWFMHTFNLVSKSKLEADRYNQSILANIRYHSYIGIGLYVIDIFLFFNFM